MGQSSHALPFFSHMHSSSKQHVNTIKILKTKWAYSNGIADIPGIANNCQNTLSIRGAALSLVICRARHVPLFLASGSAGVI